MSLRLAKGNQVEATPTSAGEPRRLYVPLAHRDWTELFALFEKHATDKQFDCVATLMRCDLLQGECGEEPVYLFPYNRIGKEEWRKGDSVMLRLPRFDRWTVATVDELIDRAAGLLPIAGSVSIAWHQSDSGEVVVSNDGACVVFRLWEGDRALGTGTSLTPLVRRYFEGVVGGRVRRTITPVRRKQGAGPDEASTGGIA